MIGKKPRFLGNKTPKGYYDKINPYVSVPSSNVNLLEMSRYARKNNKNMADLTRNEVKKFLIR